MAHKFRVFFDPRLSFPLGQPYRLMVIDRADEIFAGLLK